MHTVIIKVKLDNPFRTVCAWYVVRVQYMLSVIVIVAGFYLNCYSCLFNSTVYTALRQVLLGIKNMSYYLASNFPAA